MRRLLGGSAMALFRPASCLSARPALLQPLAPVAQRAMSSSETAVGLAEVPRVAWRLKRLAINVAPLPVSLATRLAGGRRRRSPHVYTDERSLEKEASVVSGFPAFKRSLSGNNFSGRRRALLPNTVTQTGVVMGQALASSETYAARAAAELAAAAIVVRAERAAFAEANPFGAGNGLDKWVQRVPMADRPATVGGGAPVVTQRGTLAAVRLEADVTARQPAERQRLSAKRLLKSRRAVKRRSADSEAAASLDVPPPMASGRVLGSRGAEWGAVHPDAEALARTIGARAPTLQGWLQSLPAARAAVRAARGGALDAAPAEPLWAVKDATSSFSPSAAAAPAAPKSKQPVETKVEVVEAKVRPRRPKREVTELEESRGRWYDYAYRLERQAAGDARAAAKRAAGAGAAGGGAVSHDTAAPALASAAAAGAHVLEATAVAGPRGGSGATSGAAAAGWPSAPARS